MIIGCDFHTRYQRIALMDESTGELVERRLDHESGEAHAFYRNLAGGAPLTRWQLVEKVLLVAVSAAASESQVTKTQGRSRFLLAVARRNDNE